MGDKNNTKEKQRHANKAEDMQHVTTVYNMLLNGASRYDVIQFSKKTWGYGEGNTDKLIRKANELLGEVQEDEIKSMYGKQVKRIEGLYLRCMQGGNMQTALNALRELNEITGLHREIKTDNNITIVFDKDDEEIF